MSHLPVVVNPESLFQRLNLEERQWGTRLAELEDQLRKFEDFDRPAYEEWIRVELGPSLVMLEEIFERIRARRILVHRINELVQNEDLHPREALYVVSSKVSEPFEPKKKAEAKNGWDAEEVEARRQAKRESKRAARREEKKQKRSLEKEAQAPDKNRQRLVLFYRTLARKLHPDSPVLTQKVPPSRALSLWLEVQAAYNSGNLEGLISIAAWLGENAIDEGVPGLTRSSFSFSERFERIRTMKKSCNRLEWKLAELKKHPAWTFRTVIGSVKRKLRQKAARELEDEIARTQEVLDALDEFVESIGPAKPPRGSRR